MNKRRRARWLKHLHQWHWVSSALSLACILLFSVTGITLNHAADIEATPTVRSGILELPEPLHQTLLVDANAEAKAAPKDTPLANDLVLWIEKNTELSLAQATIQQDDMEIYISLPRPGGDAWISIDRNTAELEFEDTDRGLIALLNDLHKGRDSGIVWRWLIDIFAVACLLFSLTGVALLYLHGRHRPATWPLTSVGLILPWLLLLAFVP